MKSPAPSDDELAAIVAALTALERSAPERPERAGPSRWALAGRLPELEPEDVRAGRVVL